MSRGLRGLIDAAFVAGTRNTIKKSVPAILNAGGRKADFDMLATNNPPDLRSGDAEMWGDGRCRQDIRAIAFELERRGIVKKGGAEGPSQRKRHETAALVAAAFRARFRHFRKASSTPGELAYGELIRVFHSWGNYADVLEVAEEMVSPKVRVTPGQTTLRYIVSACSFADPARTKRWYALGKRLGLPNCAFVATSLIRTAGRLGDEKAAFGTLRQMRRVGVSLDNTLLHALLSACSTLAGGRRAWALMQATCRTSGVVVSDYTLTLLLNVCRASAAGGGKAEAETALAAGVEFWKDVRQLKVAPTATSYRSLLQMFAAAGDLEGALSVFRAYADDARAAAKGGQACQTMVASMLQACATVAALRAGGGEEVTTDHAAYALATVLFDSALEQYEQPSYLLFKEMLQCVSCLSDATVRVREGARITAVLQSCGDCVAVTRMLAEAVRRVKEETVSGCLDAPLVWGDGVVKK